jgi:hypothetical protein
MHATTEELSKAVFSVWSVLKCNKKKELLSIHGHSGPKFQPVDKANAIADCIEKQFTLHKQCDENQRQVEATVQVLLVAVVNESPPPESKTM